MLKENSPSFCTSNAHGLLDDFTKKLVSCANGAQSLSDAQEGIDPECVLGCRIQIWFEFFGGKDAGLLLKIHPRQP